MATKRKGAPSDTLVDMRAMMTCLDELGDHAIAQGLPLAATLIGAASRAIADEIVERGARKPLSTMHSETVFNA